MKKPPNIILLIFLLISSALIDAIRFFNKIRIELVLKKYVRILKINTVNLKKCSWYLEKSVCCIWMKFASKSIDFFFQFKFLQMKFFLILGKLQILFKFQVAVSQRLLPLRCVVCRAKILRLRHSRERPFPSSVSQYSIGAYSTNSLCSIQHNMVPLSHSLYSFNSGSSGYSGKQSCFLVYRI